MAKTIRELEKERRAEAAELDRETGYDKPIPPVAATTVTITTPVNTNVPVVPAQLNDDESKRSRGEKVGWLTLKGRDMGVVGNLVQNELYNKILESKNMALAKKFEDFNDSLSKVGAKHKDTVRRNFFSTNADELMSVPGIKKMYDEEGGE